MSSTTISYQPYNAKQSEKANFEKHLDKLKIYHWIYRVENILAKNEKLLTKVVCCIFDKMNLNVEKGSVMIDIVFSLNWHTKNLLGLI